MALDAGLESLQSFGSSHGLESEFFLSDADAKQAAHGDLIKDRIALLELTKDAVRSDDVGD